MYKFVRKTPGHWQHEELMKFRSFAHWLKFRYYRQVEEEEQREGPAPMGVQRSFVCGDNGDRIVSFIGRFENLAQDFKEVLGRINIDNRIQLDHLNKSTNGDYKKQYSTTMVEHATAINADDIAYFDYKFE